MAERPRRSRRWLRWGIRLALISVVLLLTAYLTRRLWLEPIVIDQAETAIADALDGDVEITAIRGNWWNTFVVEGVSIRSELVDLENANVEAEISLGAVLGARWVDVLQGAKVTATSARVTIPESSEASDEPSTAGIPEDIWDLLARVAPLGVTVDIEEFELASSQATRRGPLRASLEAPGSTRAFDALLADVVVLGELRERDSLRLDVDIARPGELLRALGTGVADLRGGDAEAEILATRGGSIDIDAEIAGVTLAERGDVEAKLRVSIAPGGTWRAETANVRVPGGSVTVADLTFADPRGALPLLDSLGGRVSIDAEDCSKFADLVPEDVAPWLPKSGHVHGTFEARELRVEAGRIDWPNHGIVVQLDAGRIPLRAAEGGSGTLGVRVEFDEPRSYEVDGIPFVVQGKATADLSGSFDRLTVAAKLDLTAGRFGTTTWDRVTGDVSIDPDRSLGYDLEITGAASTAHRLRIAKVDGTARGTGTLDPLRTDTRLDLVEQPFEGRAPLRFGGPLLVADDRISTEGLSLSGPIDARVRASAALDGSRVEATCDSFVFEPEVLGSVLETDWPRGTCRGSFEIEGAPTDPTLRLDASVTVDDALTQFGVQWPKEFGPRPTDPLELRIDVARDQRTLRLEGLEATIGTLARLDVRGTAPMNWDGANFRVVPDGDSIVGTLSIDAQPRVPDAGPLRVGGRLSWDKADLRVTEVVVDAEYAGIPQQIRGDLVLEGMTPAIESRQWDDVTPRGSLTSNTFELESIPRALHGLPVLAGRLDASLEFGGKLPIPIRTGSIRLADGRVKLPGNVPTLEGLTLVADVDDSKVEIVEGTGTLGGGRFRLRGRATSATPWFADGRGAVDLELDGTDLLVVRRTGLKVRADADLAVRGNLDDLLVSGTAHMTSGAYVSRLSLLPDFGRTGGAAWEGIDVSIPEPLGSRIRWDLAVDTQEPFRLDMHVVSAPITAEVQLRGTGSSPILEGSAQALRGDVSLPGMSLKLQQALVTFNPTRPRFPEVSISARGRRLGVDVQALVEGPVDNYSVTLSSTPAMSAEDITVLISTGRLPDDLRERGLQSQAALVGTYLAQELYDFYFGSDAAERDESLADRFAFEFGREVSRNGTESLTAEFDLRSGFFLQAERDVYEDYNMGLLYRFKF